MEFIVSAFRGQWLPAVLLVLYRIEKALWNAHKAKRAAVAEAQEAKEKQKREMAERSISRGISDQVEIINSKAWEASDKIVCELNRKGVTEVITRTAGGPKQYTPAGYLAAYTKENKTYCFKRLERDLTDYLADDKLYYEGEQWHGYVEDKAGDIRDIMKTALGKRLGASEVLDRAFDEYLTYEFFLNSYTKLISMARDNQEYL
jgi:hypothetical protein